MLRAFAQDHRLRETPLAVKPKVRLLGQFPHAPFGEKLRRNSFSCGFISDVFCAFFTEFEMRAFSVRFGPSTSWTVDALLLVELQQRSRPANYAHFAPRKSRGGERRGHAARSLWRRLDVRSISFERRLRFGERPPFAERVTFIRLLFRLSQADLDFRNRDSDLQRSHVRGRLRVAQHFSAGTRIRKPIEASETGDRTDHETSVAAKGGSRRCKNAGLLSLAGYADRLTYFAVSLKSIFSLRVSIRFFKRFMSPVSKEPKCI